MRKGDRIGLLQAGISIPSALEHFRCGAFGQFSPVGDDHRVEGEVVESPHPLPAERERLHFQVVAIRRLCGDLTVFALIPNGPLDAIRG